MKQVIIEISEAEHAALKQRAAAAFRKIPQRRACSGPQSQTTPQGTTPQSCLV
jgi:hypothetical protein